jgi:hypothetical protein
VSHFRRPSQSLPPPASEFGKLSATAIGEFGLVRTISVTGWPTRPCQAEKWALEIGRFLRSRQVPHLVVEPLRQPLHDRRIRAAAIRARFGADPTLTSSRSAPAPIVTTCQRIVASSSGPVKAASCMTPGDPSRQSFSRGALAHCMVSGR